MLDQNETLVRASAVVIGVRKKEIVCPKTNFR